MKLNESDYSEIGMIAVYFGLAIMAFFTLLFWGQSPFAAFLVDHSYFYEWPTHIIFFLDFLFMCVAMMLPTIMPLMVEIRRMVKVRTPFLMALAVVLGFLVVWGLYGIIMRALGLYIASVDGISGFLGHHALLGFEILLIVCGLYMISPLAQNCANICRTPQALIEKNLPHQNPNFFDGVKLGVDYGVNCFGCCWPSMTILILLGMANPLWMLLGTIVMIWQKGPFYSRYANYIIGAAFIVAAGVIYFGAFNIKIDNSLWQAKPIFCTVKK